MPGTPSVVIEQAVAEYRPAGVFALFSGGHDSVVSTHIAAQQPSFRAVVHVNTGIGIEQTRQYVRDICLSQSWPLLELHAPAGLYEQRCREFGMPGGPVQHGVMYQLLKDDQLRQLVRDHQRRRGDVVGLVTGARKQESDRRMRVHPEPVRRERGQLWINPILDWSSADVQDYMARHGLPRNPVVDKLHRSGECLCGSLAQPEELDWIEFWYPETAAYLRNLERECYARGLPYRWGTRPSPEIDPNQQWLPLCQDCPTRWAEPASEPENEALSQASLF